MKFAIILALWCVPGVSTYHGRTDGLLSTCMKANHCTQYSQKHCPTCWPKGRCIVAPMQGDG